MRDVGRHFVRSLGGSRRAAASSPAGRSSARRLGSFLAGVARDGARRTFERLGLLQYVGQPVSALLAALSRVLAPPGATTDEAIAATAIHETMAKLLEDLHYTAGDLDAFSRMDESLARSTMERFVTELVVGRLLHVLAGVFESSVVTTERAAAVEFEMREFVAAEVERRLNREPLLGIDWESPRAQAIADDIVRQGYAIFGDSA
jgi:hypothetical protein